MNQAKAFANNDVVLLVWDYENPIENCLGFCIKRRNLDKNNEEKILESMVGFTKESIQKRQFKPTTKWPIQKYNWRDFTAQSGVHYQYSVIPMIGTPENLAENPIQELITNNVLLSPGTGKIKAYFNRGILSTQYLSNEVSKGPSGIPNYSVLLNRIKQPGDVLRNNLADELRVALLSLINKAIDEGGSCYCALYELNDAELLSKLLEAKDRIHIILSNTGADDKTNEVARSSLHDAGIDITDRMVPSGHIGHNKYIVYVRPDGIPDTVMTGSTNWTTTGLCAQSNNSIVIQSEELASHYIDYWKRMKSDSAEQSTLFRKENNHARNVQLDEADISLWFSPNTKEKNKTATSTVPEDMKKVFEAMHNAKKSIVFLAFQPGNPSIIEEAASVQMQNPNLFIRGAATDLASVDSSNVTLYHRGINEPVFVGAQELKDDFSYWMAELLKSSPTAHAIIHDKIMVIDAFTDDCIVITGSHNLGYRASYNNDENLLIIKRNQELATAYATHILDVYDHYRWRYFLNKNKGKNKFKGLNKKSSWQDAYFNEFRGESIDKRFWL